MRLNSQLQLIAKGASKIIFMCLLLGACRASFADIQNTGPAKTKQTSIETPNIVVVYQGTKKYASIRRQLQKSRVLEGIFANVQSFMMLPGTLSAEYKQCDEENAFYDPESKKIVICYELVKWLQDTAKKQEPKIKDQQDYFENVFTFFALHELGHSLIDLYNLPITGKEEDVADQIAVYMLVQDGQQVIIDTGSSFYKDLQDMSAEELPFADGHSLDRQRYYNLLCWVYGSDEQEFDFLIKGGYLDQERADYCPGEYQKLVQGVDQLLGRYMKPEPNSSKSAPN